MLGLIISTMLNFCSYVGPYNFHNVENTDGIVESNNKNWGKRIYMNEVESIVPLCSDATALEMTDFTFSLSFIAFVIPI